MADKRPGYQDWKSKPDLSGETPDTPQGHAMMVWLWIIGLVLLSLVLWGVAYLATFLQPPPHTNSVQ